ncbi:TPA: hypothetical protein MO340_004231 [Salmonella enterica subsp. salamae serovar 35:g,m,s,t:-]|nr:hypothetical protein [Salmonella enterica subsp. salamae serovar 35:g,m,s,t:-]HCA3549703.1 hypothetical protein [Salmonella enterica subsp. salamae serovar 35:g,m,s,t:-]
MARPTKSESEKLSKTVAWRVTEGVFLELNEMYKASGLTQSEFLRELLDERKEHVTIVARKKTSTDTRRLIFLANKNSNNVNQLAHKVNLAHQTGLVNESLYLSLLVALEHNNKIMGGFVNDAD